MLPPGSSSSVSANFSKSSQAGGNQKAPPEPKHPPVWAYPLGKISWVVTLDPTLKGWVGRRPSVLLLNIMKIYFRSLVPRGHWKILTKWTPFKCNYLGGPHTGVAMPCPGPSSKVWPYLSLHSRGGDSRILGTRRLWEAMQYQAESLHLKEWGLWVPQSGGNSRKTQDIAKYVVFHVKQCWCVLRDFISEQYFSI